MTEIELKIEKYISENFDFLKRLNSLNVSDTSSKTFILSEQIFDFIEPLMSRYSSFSILKKMLKQYVYNLSVTKTEKEYFFNKLYKQIGSLSKRAYIDVPDCVDRKSLIYFEEEFRSSIGGFLVGIALKSNSVNKDFKTKCLNSIKNDSSSMKILFIRDNLNEFEKKDQTEISKLIKKFLKRILSVKLIYPIIDHHYHLMLTPEQTFQNEISRESIVEKVESNLVEVITRLLERNHRNKSENQINDHITDLLRSKMLNISDQTRSRLSQRKMDAGEIDIMVRDENGLPLTIIECVKLSRVSKKSNKNLAMHILKLLDNYDGLGLTNKSLLVYCFADNFQEFVDNYLWFLISIQKRKAIYDFQIDSVGSLIKPFGNDISNLKCIPTFHKVNGVYQKINHFLINLNN